MPTPRVSTFRKRGRHPYLSCLGLQAAQSSKTVRPVTLDQKILILLCIKHLQPSASAKRTEKSDPACYNGNGKQQRKDMLQMGTTKVATTKRRTPNLAHVSRRAVSPFLATCLCGMTKASVSAPVSHSPSRGQDTRILRITAVLTGVMTPHRSAPTTRTVEKKGIIHQHRVRDPRNRAKYPVYATLCDIL